MANANSTSPLAPKEIVGTYPIFSGVNVSIECETAQDYAGMIADQFVGLACDLAHACDKFMVALVDALRVSGESLEAHAEKGGAS